MSVEFDLFKTEKKERFELGKCNWPFVFYRKGNPFKIKELFDSPRDLYIALLQHISKDFENKTPLSFFKKLADDLYTWCGEDKVSIYNCDAFAEEHWEEGMNSYDSLEKEYPYTGSRFKRKMDPKDIEFKIAKLTLKEDEILVVKIKTNDKIQDSDKWDIVASFELELSKWFKDKFFIYFDDDLEISVINYANIKKSQE